MRNVNAAALYMRLIDVRSVNGQLAARNYTVVAWTENTAVYFLLTFAICYRPSVCRRLLTFVRPTQAVQIFGNISTAFGNSHPLTSTENFTEIVPGEPLRRGS